MRKRYFLLIILCLLMIYLYLSPDFLHLSSYIRIARLTKLSAMILAVLLLVPSTVVFQTLVNSSYLSPSILGLDAFFLFIHTLLVAFPIGLISGTNYLLTGFQLLVMVVLNQLLFNRISVQEIQQLNQGKWLMVGLIIGNILRALTSFIQMLMDPTDFLQLQSRLLVSFQGIEIIDLIVTATITGVTLLYLYRKRYVLDVYQLGSTTATSLGVNVSKEMRQLMMVIVIMVSIATALVGPLTFLGFLVANMTLRFSPNHKHLHKLAMASLIGMAMVIAGQLVLERLLNMGTNLSVLLEGTGGLLYFILVFRRSKT